MRVAGVVGAVGLFFVSACLDHDGGNSSESSSEQSAELVSGVAQSLETSLCGSMEGLQANAPWAMFGGCPSHAAQSSKYGPTTNQKNWSTYLWGNVKSSPVVAADGSIFVGSDAGKIFKINRSNGAIVKQASLVGEVESAPAIAADGTIYVGSSLGKVYALDPNTLATKWSYSALGGFDSSPAVAPDGTIYIGSSNSSLYALNPNGTKKWSYLMGSPVNDSPAVGADGTIYIGSAVTLYALNPNGTKKWSRPIGFPITSSPALGRFGRVYVGGGDKLVALDTATGNILWAKSLGSCTIYAPSIDKNGVIYVGTGFSLLTGGALYAVSPDGDVLWHFDVFGGVQSTPIIDKAGNIYFGANDNKIYAVDPTGQEIWKYGTLGNVQSSPALDSTGAVVVGSNDNQLYSIGVGASRVANGGSCSTDEQCVPGLVCGLANGPRFGLAAGTRSCWVPTCENKIQDPGETELDCGGPCGSCTNVCSVACKVGDQVQAPALEVLPLSKASFVRASFGTYNVGARILSTAPGHVLRFDDRGDGKGRLALFEGQRTNRVRFSEQLGHSPEWRMPTGGTPIVEANDYALSPMAAQTADRMTAPAGGYPSRTQTINDNLPPGILSAWLRLSNTTAAPSSTRAVLSDSLKRWYSSPTPWQLTGMWERRTMATTATTCAADLSFSHKAGWPGAVAIFPQLAAADFVAWGMQLEEGAFASSYIPTSDDAETRYADRLVFEAKDVPAWVRTGIWQLDVAPIFASNEVATTEEMTLLAWETGRLVLGRDANGTLIQIVSGSSTAKINVSWNAGTKLTLTLDFAAHTLTVRGASSGDGAVNTGAIAIATGRLSMGARLDGSKAAFARISELRRVSSPTTACVPDADCVVCGDGIVNGGEACDYQADHSCNESCDARSTTEYSCTDAFDNDRDLLIDCRDGDCLPSLSCLKTEPTGPITYDCGAVGAACTGSCTASCTTASCGGDRSDHCGGICRGFCDSTPGCQDDRDCASGRFCDVRGGARHGSPTQVNLCTDNICRLVTNDPLYCGFAGALCGPVCLPPTRTPDCADRECGTSPGDGMGGSCGTCSAGQICAGAGYCVAAAVEPKIPGVSSIEASLTNPNPPPSDSTIRVKGDFGVVAGAATYRLPIDVPPGRAEMTPELAFTYNSFAGPSAVGDGWDIDGLSNIRRCTVDDATAIDGIARVSFKLTDTFCLDSKPLLLQRATSEGEFEQAAPEAGTAAYTYQVSGSPQLRATGFAYDEYGPKYFIVQDGTGRSHYYGSTDASSEYKDVPVHGASNRPNKKLSWWIARTQDAHLNTIEFDYDVNMYTSTERFVNAQGVTTTREIEDTTARYLRSVSYTGRGCADGTNSCATREKPTRAVVFEYRELPIEHGNDPAPLVNPRQGQRKVLEVVKVKLDDRRIREYRLSRQATRQLVPDQAHFQCA